MRKIGVLILMICIIGIGVSGYMLFSHFNKLHKNDKAFEKLEEKSYDDLLAKNDDTVGWIKIKDTKISYPVMHSPDRNNFYLDRNFEKEYSVSGSIFVDETINPYDTNHLLLYGHKMYDNSMFGSLLEYSDEDYYMKHKYVEYTEIKKSGRGVDYRYEIIAAFPTETYAEPNYINFSHIEDEDSFNEYLSLLKKNSPSFYSADAVYGDELITLSTCSYHVEKPYGRYVVVARKVRN